MATRAATFTAKLHTLSDYYFRTRHNILPLPSGIDIASTLKYFSQTLLGVLKDVPSIPLEMMRTKEQDHVRLGLFPILDYKGLYHVVVQLVDVIPLIQQGVHVLGQSLLHTMVCCVPFLEHEHIDMLPHLVASTITIFPESLHQDIIDTLCNHLLPYTITADSENVENRNYATLSTAAIIMTVFQYSSKQAHHSQLLECLMSLKRDIIKDIFCVIAHGTSVARGHATTLLFHYWPSLNPTPYDKRGIPNNLPAAWKSFTCQRENCLSGDNNDAVKVCEMCLDPAIAIGTGDHPPPLYICQGCCDQIRQEADTCHLIDILLPMQQVSLTCENKNCRATDRTSLCTCFSMECASYNGNRPIRYCSQCHSIRHNNRRGGNHVVHLPVESPWKSDAELHTYLVEAIISLLREAQAIADRNSKVSIDHHIRAALREVEDQVDSNILEERRMLSRYGIYLLVGLCSPTEDTPVETLGRLLAMLFQWFDATAYLRDDQAGSLLERLKSEYVYNWLMEVCKSHSEVFISCLLPHPPDYARVGGHWDTVTGRTGHIKEGFNRLFCLVPYEIISLNVWDQIMGYWMEAIRTEVPEQELPELKMLLSKVLDSEMSPLGFDAHSMYRFFAVRFRNKSARVQEQALQWLQILCELDVVVPLSLIFSMFNDGIQSMKSSLKNTTDGQVQSGTPQQSNFNDIVVLNDYANDDLRPTSPSSDDDHMEEKTDSFKEDAELYLPCFVLMLDILLKQLELQEVTPNQGLEHIVSQETLTALREMISTTWIGRHTCKDEDSYECIICETCIIFYQLGMEVLEYICPLPETSDLTKVVEAEMGTDDNHNRGVQDESHSKVDGSGRTGDALAVSMKEIETRQHEKHETEMISPLPIFTATVQTVAEAELQTVSIIPTEEVVKAVAHAITLSETDVGSAKVSVVQATIVDENEQPLPLQREASMEDEGMFWQTSQGKFKFTLDELPASLQLIHLLLKELDEYDNADVLYHILNCLKVLCFRAECLAKASREHRGFLIWCQENLLINNLWKQLRLEYSHVAQIAVQILLHCLTLPSGADTFWRIVETGFHHDDWKVRYGAVEKVTAITRFLEPNVVHHSSAVQSSMANVFSYLISSLDDLNPHVAQRATLFLDNLQSSSLKCLSWCLEAQFDMVILDRPVILQTLYQLYSCLPDRSVLSWDFFLNRFDTLFLEAQVNLEKSGDIVCPRDLKNTNTASDVFTQKLNRAHEALNQATNQNMKSLSASLGPKLRYKRAMSAPCGMTCKQEKLIEKEKLFSRQSSAPVLKRKSSKFGVAHLHHPLAAHFPNHLFPDGHLKEHSHDEQNFLSMFHKLMEMEDRDQDTIHLLIFLLMQFLAQPEHAYPTDEKAAAKTQNLVLRHLNLLLGYSPQEKGFCIPPSRMRVSPVFNAFLSNLPRVLDRNIKMATILLPICIPLLLYCPAPLKSSSEALHLGYTLWCLETRCRQSWLHTVCVLLYKYRYNVLPLSKQVLALARIVLNTLSSHNHRCQNSNDSNQSTVSNAPHSREMSMISAGELGNIQERETPPYSPRTTVEGVVVTITAPVEGKVFYQKIMMPSDEAIQAMDSEQHWRYRKMPDFTIQSDADDNEPELEAIPESPKTESPPGDSLQDSIGELETIEESYPEKAHVRIKSESASFMDDGMVIISTPWQGATKIASAIVCQPEIQRVEQQMVRQIQAFHLSFDKDKTSLESEEQTTPEVSPRHNHETVIKSLPTSAKSHLPFSGTDSGVCVSEDSGDTFLRRMTVQADSVFIGKLVTSRTEREPMTPHDSKSQQEAGKAVRVSKSPSLTTCASTQPQLLNSSDGEWPSHSEVKAYWEGAAQGSMRLSGQRFEVLDASQLENTVLRREPAIVSQQGQGNRQSIAPYLFQPIQSHPVTKDKGKIETVVVSPTIRVEPKRTLTLEVQRDSSPTETVTEPPKLKSVMPWTIEIHSPIKLEPVAPTMPSPERLLPVGPMKVDGSFSTAETDRSCALTTCRPFFLEDESAPQTIRTQFPTTTTSVEHGSMKDQRQQSSTADKDSKPLFVKQMVQAENVLEHPEHKKDSFELTSVVVSNSTKFFEENKTGTDDSDRSTLEVIVVDKTTGHSSWKSNGSFDDDNHRPMTASCVRVSTDSLGIVQPDRVIIHEPVVVVPSAETPSVIHPSEISMVTPRVKTETHYDAAAFLKTPSFPSGGSVDYYRTVMPGLSSPSTATTFRESLQKDEALPKLVSEDDGSTRKSMISMEPSSFPTKNMQRLHPSFRRATEVPLKSPVCPSASPRPLTKAFDSHLEPLYTSSNVTREPESDGSGPGGPSAEMSLDHEPVVSYHFPQHNHRHDHDEIRSKSHFRPRRPRKNVVDPQKSSDMRNAGSRKSKKGDYSPVCSGSYRGQHSHQPGSQRGLAEDVITDHCPDCGAVLEQYSDEELGLCIVVLATFIHREPAAVAPLLPEILHTVSRIASSVLYPWEVETNTYIPGNARSIARQFLRCILHQLAPSGVFIQIFQSTIDEPEFFKTIAMALADFVELNPMAPMQLLLEGLNDRKTLPQDNILRIMENVASYMDCLQLEISVSAWVGILTHFETFFRKLVLILPANADMTPTLRIICSILHIQGLNSYKTILDPFSKIMSFSIQSCSFQYQTLLDVCHLCNRAFSKERDRLYMSRTVVFELVQALKFKTNIPDDNLLKLVQFIIQDAGGTLGPSIILEDMGTTTWDVQNMINTSASECMRQYFNEALDFIADVHTLSKIKSNFKGTVIGLNEDTLGGALKAGVAQFLALEITRGNNRENRAINRYLPWLYNPLPTVQQGPREFIDCVMHIRLLSWLLLGSLIHTLVIGANSNLICQPIPLEASGHIADHVQVILAGFAEQSKASVLHMSSLFHAFILCQLWTMYCEQLTSLNVPGSDPYHLASVTIVDFWAKVTPGILQLLSHSKVLAEMVTLHFLSLIEALIECDSTVLAKLFPMWRPVLHSYHNQLPGHLVVRLQACENRPPPSHNRDATVASSATMATLLKWVQRLQFKMGQIELQSSAATQFYSV